MRRDRIPSAAEMMRLPAGDRALRLRRLAQWHGERMALMEARGSKAGATRHRSSLRKVQAVAAQVGEGLVEYRGRQDHATAERRRH